MWWVCPNPPPRGSTRLTLLRLLSSPAQACFSLSLSNPSRAYFSTLLPYMPSETRATTPYAPPDFLVPSPPTRLSPFSSRLPRLRGLASAAIPFPPGPCAYTKTNSRAFSPASYRCCRRTPAEDGDQHRSPHRQPRRRDQGGHVQAPLPLDQ